LGKPRFIKGRESRRDIDVLLSRALKQDGGPRVSLPSLELSWRPFILAKVCSFESCRKYDGIVLQKRATIAKARQAHHPFPSCCSSLYFQWVLKIAATILDTVVPISGSSSESDLVDRPFVVLLNLSDEDMLE